jgi:hypothetical protein
MKMEQTECSETLAYEIQMLGNYPEESIQNSEHSESLKSADEDSSVGNVTAVRSILFLTNKEDVHIPKCTTICRFFFLGSK